MFRQSFGIPAVWPLQIADITSFIVFLFRSGVSHSTVKCYISGLSFHSQINNLPDPTNSYLIKKILEGFKRSKGPTTDTRLPITYQLLTNIIGSLGNVCTTVFETKLFAAAFSLAFHGCFRVGELTFDPRNAQNHHLTLKNIRFLRDTLDIFLGSSKTDQFGKGTQIKLNKLKDDITCPVFLLSDYIKQRPPGSGILFCHFDSSPVTAYQFSAVLKKTLNFLGINPTRYSAHSFRIGSASYGYLNGLNASEIKDLGRWKSKAYKRYLRC
ncbi:hypothetical protein SNE40_022736 [Patella caerulea]|uniref:Tyr recombinase domain-containing protein n=1 Tax=Patella caerulea TaxID=87958 RepID=A0AAN8IVC3_PATCE